MSPTAALSLAFDVLARDHASKTFENVGDSAEKAGKRGAAFGAIIGAGVAGAALAIGKFAADSIGSASDMNETLSKSNNVFGDAAKQVTDWSKTSATSFGLSQQAALAATSQFGDMFHQLGFTQQASAKTSENVVKLAADLGSFHNVDPSDVLDRIGGAMRGEYDSLQQLIPNISAATVQQEALRQTHKKSVTDLTAAEKATATLSIIQRDGANAANDFAETSGGLANQQRILKAEFENLHAQIGAKLLPIMVDLAGKFQSLIQFTQEHANVIKPLVVVLGGLAAVVLTIIEAQKAWIAVQTALNIVMSLNPIGLVVIAIAALVVGLVLAWKHSETFRTVVKSVFSAVAGFVLSAIDIWLGAYQKLFEAMGHIPIIGDKFKAVADKIGGVRDKVEGLKDSLKGLPEVKHIRVDLAVNGINTLQGVTDKLDRLDGARAMGGAVRAGGSYLVGERGPEILTMPGNGYVTPNSGIGGATYNINVPAIDTRDRDGAARAVALAIRMAT